MDSSASQELVRRANQLRDASAETSIYACGFNAFGQLSTNTKDDLFRLEKLSDETIDANFDVFFAGWSETVC